MTADLPSVEERLIDEPLVRLRHVSVRYGRRWALRDIDLDVPAGGHLAILGGNGSGKTTLLRLIAGEIWPAPDSPDSSEDDGRAEAPVREYRLGRGVEHDALSARERIRLVGPETQDRHLGQRLRTSGRTVVATGFSDSFILRHELTPEQRRQVEKCLLRTGARGFADRPFVELSRGEQRRILLARALVSEPAVLCLDEICDGLDDQARARLLSLLDRLAAGGLTLVMATHHADDLPACVRRRIVLDRGAIVATHDVADAPAPRPVRPDPGPLRQSAGAPDARRERRRGSRTGQQPLISVRHADVYRGRRRALVDLSWDLLPGTHWLVTGPNGAGKSTFIKLLYGELRPALGGSIAWFGCGPRVDVWTLRRRIGLVSDELQAQYLDRLCVRDCVATGFVASIGRVPQLDAERQVRVARWLKVVRMNAHADTPIRELSYGQLRRALLARALVLEPEVLLLDEAASGLDRDTRGILRATLAEAAARGTHVVMAGHRIDENDGPFTHQLALRNGRRIDKNDDP